MSQRHRTRGPATASPVQSPDTASAYDIAVEAYSHLLSGTFTLQQLRDAIAEADRCNLPIPQILTARGWVSPQDYARKTASALRLPFVAPELLPHLIPGAPANISQLPAHIVPHTATLKHPSMSVLVVDPSSISITELKNLAATHTAVALTSWQTIRTLTLRNHASTMLANATDGLAKNNPQQSASLGVTGRQRVGMAGAAAVIALLAVLAPTIAATLLMFALASVFFVVVLLRLAALILAAVSSARFKPQRLHRQSDAALPIYTLLVPLFKEANIVPSLVDALLKLDYPRAKLDIKLIVEDIDVQTQTAISELNLPACFDVIVVPNGQPRTKPRALNYALHFARGTYAVIYDAEDRPDADQLHHALRAFAVGPANLACCQAQLNLYNPTESWLARQFTVEYSALFDTILPAYHALRFPIPLGGTSNHFRTSVLRQLSGWDAYNVTEDADLGIRLIRHGYKTTVIPSTTYEEAPVRFRHWLPQRTRWIKGWLQTWFVHTRNHRHLRQALGLWSTIGFHAIFIGQLASTLVHPLFYLAAGYYAWTGDLFATTTNLAHEAFRAVSLSNLICGYAASIGLGLFAVVQRRHLRLLLTPFTMPIYWLIISAAAYRAVWQLWRNPFYWEKTPHGISKAHQKTP